MKKLIFAATLLCAVSVEAAAQSDTVSHKLDDVVVTGTRSTADVRHLPMTISVVDREKLIENQRTNVLPTLSEQVPGLFVTSRSMMGYWFMIPLVEPSSKGVLRKQRKQNS